MPPYVERDESGRITCQYNALAPEFQQARNYLSTNKLQERLHEYPHVHEEAARLGVTFDEAVADICARWPEWVDEAELVDGLHQENSEQPHAGDQQEHVSDGEQDADHAEELPHTDDTSDNISEDARQIDDIREAYEASYDDGAGDVGIGEHTGADLGGDGGEPVEAGPDADPGGDSVGGGDYSAEPLAGDPEPSEEHQTEDVSPANSGGVLIQGDAVSSARAIALLRVDDERFSRVGEYDKTATEARLNQLRSQAMGAKEGSLPPLTDEQHSEFQSLEFFLPWYTRIDAYAQSLRDEIRAAQSVEAIEAIDITNNWPD